MHKDSSCGNIFSLWNTVSIHPPTSTPNPSQQSICHHKTLLLHHRNVMKEVYNKEEVHHKYHNRFVTSKLLQRKQNPHCNHQQQLEEKDKEKQLQAIKHSRCCAYHFTIHSQQLLLHFLSLNTERNHTFL